jgi:hypothetical protein
MVVTDLVLRCERFMGGVWAALGIPCVFGTHCRALFSAYMGVYPLWSNE